VNNRFKSAAAGALTSLAGVSTATAQGRWWNDDDDWTDIASAGNGGVATASANGGAVSVGNINSGGNVCNAIGIGDTFGPDPAVYGGDCFNTTALDISAGGGTAIADASGGNYNIAFVS
jgi:hypothetical protein